MSLWRALEEVAGLRHTAAVWVERAGLPLAALVELGLRETGSRAGAVLCAKGCGAWHEVLAYGDGKWGAVCDRQGGQEFEVASDTLIVREMNLCLLGRGIVRAWGIPTRELDLDLPRTRQIGAVGGAALPVCLTVQTSAAGLRQVVAELATRLREPFALLTPTNRMVDAKCKAVLASVRAGCFDLESHLTLTASGRIEARRPAAEVLSVLLRNELGARADGGCEGAQGGHAARGRLGPRYLFRQAGSMWDVVFEGSRLFHLPDLHGARYLDYLLHHPNEPIGALALEQAVMPEKETARTRNSAQKTLDAKAKRQLQEEVGELKAELEDAAAENATETVQRLREEIRQLEEHAGKDGLLEGDSGEKARDNVRKAIDKVMQRLRKGGKAEQAFGQHIGQFVSLGYEVSYNQAPGMTWE